MQWTESTFRCSIDCESDDFIKVFQERIPPERDVKRSFVALASLQITLYTCVKAKLFHRQTANKREKKSEERKSFHLSDSSKRAEKQEKKEINKKRSANSRRENYCLQRWGKAHFSTSMELGPFNPRQHSLARYLFPAHQSLSLSHFCSLFNSFLSSSSSLCVFLLKKREKVSLDKSQPPS